MPRNIVYHLTLTAFPEEINTGNTIVETKRLEIARRKEVEKRKREMLKKLYG